MYQSVESIIINIKGKSLVEIKQELCRMLEINETKNQDTETFITGDNIKKILFWLQNGIKPNGMSDTDFLKLKPICEKLVANNELKEQILNNFN